MVINIETKYRSKQKLSFHIFLTLYVWKAFNLLRAAFPWGAGPRSWPRGRCGPHRSPGSSLSKKKGLFGGVTFVGE